MNFCQFKSRKIDIYLNLRHIIGHNMRMNAISGCGDEQRMDYYGRTNWKIVRVDEIWIVIFIQKNRHLRKTETNYCISSLFFIQFHMMKSVLGFSLISCSMLTHMIVIIFRGLEKTNVIISIQSQQ